MANIGNVTSMQIKSSDSTGMEYTTTITSKNAIANPAATYAEVDTFARALNALSTNTYKDTILITSVSVNETLFEE